MNYIQQINAFWERLNTEINLKPSSISVYMVLLNLNNKCGWKVRFRVVRESVCEVVGISYNTYYSCLEELVQAGYIIYKKSPNQHQAAVIEIIQLSQNLVEQPHSTLGSNLTAPEQQPHSTLGSNCTIPKLLNNKQKTTKPINSNTELFSSDKDDQFSFEKLWELYDKKTGDKIKIKKKWDKVKLDDRKIAFEHIPKYKLSQPNKKYRKNLETYINNHSWNDEIIESRNGKEIGTAHTIVSAASTPDEAYYEAL